MLDGHHRGAEHAGLAAGAGGDDPQVLGRQRQGAVVDGLADAGQQVLAGLGHLAADHHDRRVDQVDHGGDHVADVAARLADGRDREGVAGAHQVDDVLAVLGRASPRRGSGCGERGPGGHGLEAAGVAAAAGHVVGAGHADVAEVAGDAGGAALQPAAGDDAGADAGRDLDQHQVVDVGQVRLLLAERHDVDVVVDEDGHGVLALETSRDVVAVPARHDRRADRPAGRVLDRAGQADADRGQVLDRAALRLRAARARSSTPSRARPRGPRRRRGSRSTSPRISPERSASAARTWVAPTSTPTTTLAAGLSAKSAGGRPPVERAPPNGATSSSRMSTSMRAAMVDRARPVASASSARVQGRPSRSSSKMSPACTGEQ